VFAPVELGALEGERESAQAFRHEALRRRGDKRRVEPAAQIRADRHVRAQPDAGGVEQEVLDFIGKSSLGARVMRPFFAESWVVERPIGADDNAVSVGD